MEEIDLTQETEPDELHVLPNSSDLNELDLGDVVRENGFRFAAKKVFLTYKNFLDKQELFQKMNVICTVTECIIAHEVGSSGYQHTHGFFKFDRKFQSRNVRIFDINGIHPNIHVVMTPKHESNIVQYCSKFDVDPFKYNCGSLAERVWECDNLGQAVRQFVTKPAEVVGIERLWKLKPVAIPRNFFDFGLEDLTPFRQWQKDALVSLTRPPGDRRIVWYSDLDGSKGKTYLGRWLVNYGLTVYVSTFSVPSVSLILKNHLETGLPLHLVIFNLARQAETKLEYSILEMVKDKLFTSTKYQSATVSLPNDVHVWVFANWLPDYRQLSADRLLVINL